jgi:hypothetical protein
LERSGKRYSGKPGGVAERPKEKLQLNKTIRKFKGESQQAFLVSLRAGKFLFYQALSYSYIISYLCKIIK